VRNQAHLRQILRDTRRQIAHHVGKLGALGFEVTLARIPAPEPDDPATTPAA
jgi:hypothetical protein